MAETFPPSPSLESKFVQNFTKKEEELLPSLDQPISDHRDPTLGINESASIESQSTIVDSSPPPTSQRLTPISFKEALLQDMAMDLEFPHSDSSEDVEMSNNDSLDTNPSQQAIPLPTHVCEKIYAS